MIYFILDDEIEIWDRKKKAWNESERRCKSNEIENKDVIRKRMKDKIKHLRKCFIYLIESKRV